MTHRHAFDPARSRFTVQAFATGMLSFLGHDPTFAVRDFTGAVWFDPQALPGTTIELTARADSLALLDHVSPADRDEIEGRMRREVLETAAYPEITFRTDHVAAQSVGPNHFRLDLGGRLDLHGVVQPYRVQAELVRDGGDGSAIHLRGQDRLEMSGFRIRPVTAAAGAIRLKDVLAVSFDIVGLPEAT